MSDGGDDIDLDKFRLRVETLEASGEHEVPLETGFEIFNEHGGFIASHEEEEEMEETEEDGEGGRAASAGVGSSARHFPPERHHAVVMRRLS